MKTVVVDHLKCSKPRPFGMFRTKFATDYETVLGIVREISSPSRMPRYKLMDTKEPVKVEFI